MTYHKIGAHGQALAIFDFLHAQLGGHVIISSFISDTPSHVHHLIWPHQVIHQRYGTNRRHVAHQHDFYLKFQTVFLPTVVLQFRIDLSHQSVSFHRRIYRESFITKSKSNFIHQINSLKKKKNLIKFFFNWKIEKFEKFEIFLKD